MASILVTCGANGNGQLGIGRSDVTVLPEYTTVHLPLGEEVSVAVAGGYHTIAVTKNGHVFCWGMNKNGQIGQPTEQALTSSVPQRLHLPAPEGYPEEHMTKDGERTVVSASAGEFHTLLLTSDGEVLTMGCNAVGQLGRLLNNDASHSHVPEAVDFSGLLVPLKGNVTICQVFCGPSTSFAVTPSGHLFGWGGSSSGELGIQQGIVPTPRSIVLPSSLHHTYKVIRVAAGPSHTLLLTSSGEVFVAGDNGDGQLGVPVTCVHSWRAIRHAKHLRDLSTNCHQSFFLTPVGILSECGTQPSKGGEDRSPMVSPDLVYELKSVDCAGVTAGGSCVVAWTQNGEIYCRGPNHRGQLAQGHITTVPVFTKVSPSKLPAGKRPSNISLGRAHCVAVFVEHDEDVHPMSGMVIAHDDEFNEDCTAEATASGSLLSRSCVDEICPMNLSLSRSKAPVLSFAAANRSFSHGSAARSRNNTTPTLMASSSELHQSPDAITSSALAKGILGVGVAGGIVGVAVILWKKLSEARR